MAVDERMPCFSSCVRLLSTLSLTFCVFVLEVAISRMNGSLAVLSDSFHVLWNVTASLGALIALRFGDITRTTTKNTFGWIRADLLASLISAVFLSALCFIVMLDAVERLAQPRTVENPEVLLGVGFVAFLVKLLGLSQFQVAINGQEDLPTKNSRRIRKSRTNIWTSDRQHKTGTLEETNNLMENYNSNPNPSSIKENINAHVEVLQAVNDVIQNTCSDYTGPQLNHKPCYFSFHSPLLHVFRAMLGSAIVLIEVLVLTFVQHSCAVGEACISPCVDSLCGGHHSNNTAYVMETSTGPCWVLYLDPVLCIVMGCMLLCVTFPPLKISALVLLQAVPKQIDVQQLDRGLRSLEGVLAVHELHIWQLADSKIVASVHVQCHDPAAYVGIIRRIDNFFRTEGVHTITVQPEFSDASPALGMPTCQLPCLAQCGIKLCCSMSQENPTLT